MKMLRRPGNPVVRRADEPRIVRGRDGQVYRHYDAPGDEIPPREQQVYPPPAADTGAVIWGLGDTIKDKIAQRMSGNRGCAAPPSARNNDQWFMGDRVDSGHSYREGDQHYREGDSHYHEGDHHVVYKERFDWNGFANFLNVGAPIAIIVFILCAIGMASCSEHLFGHANATPSPTAPHYGAVDQNSAIAAPEQASSMGGRYIGPHEFISDRPPCPGRWREPL